MTIGLIVVAAFLLGSAATLFGFYRWIVWNVRRLEELADDIEADYEALLAEMRKRPRGIGGHAGHDDAGWREYWAERSAEVIAQRDRVASWFKTESDALDHAIAEARWNSARSPYLLAEGLRELASTVRRRVGLPPRSSG